MYGSGSFVISQADEGHGALDMFPKSRNCGKRLIQRKWFGNQASMQRYARTKP